MEQLTRDKSIETFQIVRKLIRFIPKLPQQAAFSLYNYIIGYIMFYVRHPREKGKGPFFNYVDQIFFNVWTFTYDDVR